MADWGTLPGSAVVLIARSLQSIEDFVAFRATCSSWLKATTLNDFYTCSSSSCPKLPLLMLYHYEERRIHFDKKEVELRLESLRHVQNEDPEANHHNDEMDYENYQMDENVEIVLSEDLDDDDEGSIDQDGMDENNEIVLIEDLDDNDEGSIDENNEMDEIVLSEDLDDDDQGSIDDDDHKGSIDDEDECSVDDDGMDEKDPEDNQEKNEMVQRKDDLDDQHKFVRLIQRESFEANHERKFFSLSKQKTSNIPFPEAKGMEYRGSKGWLIMVERSTGNMCLFHPISRLQIPLPKVPISGVMIQPKNFISGVLSARPSETSDYVVMVVFMEEIYTSPGRGVFKTYTGFWKPGNLNWTKVDIPYWVEDLSYYNGNFYALTKSAQLWMCHVSGPNPKASKIVKLPWRDWSRPDAQLVECGGRLLIVAPYSCGHPDMASENDLEMVEIDVIKGSYNTITSLGTSAVFLGRNEGFSIDANTFPGIIEQNSIYFGDGSYHVATPGPNHESEPNYRSGMWINF